MAAGTRTGLVESPPTLRCGEPQAWARWRRWEIIIQRTLQALGRGSRWEISKLQAVFIRVSQPRFSGAAGRAGGRGGETVGPQL